MRSPVSALILTLNEEVNLPRCIESLQWVDDIIVLDSGSKDATVEIAKALGCRVFHRPFDNWSSHQNWAVKHLPFRHSWVLNIDADEVVTPELREELSGIATCPNPVGFAALRMRRRDYFHGVWLKHSTFYPTWLVRFYRPEAIRFERLVNPVTIAEGATGSLQGHIDHQPFSKGIAHWVERHNSYSTFEAQEYLNRGEWRWSMISSRDPNVRRRALKSLFSRLPCRPVMKFCYLYLFHLGFLDGLPGFQYCALQSFYEFMISLKTRELRRTRNAGVASSVLQG